MADLRGGSTVNGYTILHSGLSSAFLAGSLTIGGKINNTSGGVEIIGVGGSFNENIRCPLSSNSWSSIMLGTTAGTTSGTADGVWGIFRNNNGNFVIANNASGESTGLCLTKAGSMNWYGSMQLSGSLRTPGGMGSYSQLVGDYVANNTANKMIWTIGDNWNSWGSHYGIGYEYGSFSGSGNDHQITIREAGTTHIRFGMAGNIACDGNIVGSNVYNAIYNDYAEFFEKNEEVEQAVEPGDVIMKSPRGNWYCKSEKTNQKSVIGVCSNEYAQCIGGPDVDVDERKKQCIAIGLSGRVHVKVTGDVKVGDKLISSSIPGVAIKKRWWHFNANIIGKALENHSGREVSKIRMLIMNA